ncbi:MAG: TIGR03546 family protein [Planctomycetaceae bacterium]|nr:TIGR03546 family protein [Planctomycetaceae bacterium]
MFLIIRPVRLVFKALVTEATPGQLALGFALGVLVGLVPKGNLLAIALGIVLAASRANLGIAAATILVFSFISPWFDPASDYIGTWLLSLPSMQQTWTDLYNTPLMPWTSFNNSIVMGSFILGVLLLYPNYRLSRPVFEKYTQKLSVWSRRYRITRYLLGAELVGLVNSNDSGS